VTRGTTPQVTDNPPKGTTAGHPASTASSGPYAEGAGLEPDPAGWAGHGDCRSPGHTRALHPPASDATTTIGIRSWNRL